MRSAYLSKCHCQCECLLKNLKAWRWIVVCSTFRVKRSNLYLVHVIQMLEKTVMNKCYRAGFTLKLNTFAVDNSGSKITWRVYVDAAWYVFIKDLWKVPELDLMNMQVLTQTSRKTTIELNKYKIWLCTWVKHFSKTARFWKDLIVACIWCYYSFGFMFHTCTWRITKKKNLGSV